jgi:hypothetical protein
MHKTFTPVSGGLVAPPEIPGVSLKGYFGRTGSLFSGWLALLILTFGFTGPTQAATITVCPDGCDYSTIQSAITAASSGDVINVQAGTYTGDISVSKSLTLNGPNAGVSGYDQNRVTEAQLLNGRLTVSGTNTIVIDGFHLYNTNNTSIDMILVNSTTTTVTIKNNRFERAGTVGGVIARGIATAIGITTPVVIENNFFTGDPSGGLFGGHLTLNNGIFSNGGSNVMIRANKFDQVRTALNVDNMSAGVTITENIFEENGTALSFGGTTATSGSYTVSGNSFKVTGTIANLSNVTTSFRMDLTGNTFDGKASADLSLAEALNIERTLFHRGRSSRNGAVTFVSNTQFVVTQNPSIQNAITYSEAGGVVQVEAGTFAENVNINKSLDIRGANYGLACGSRGPETVIAPATGLPVNVTADGVTINGFEITAPSYQYAILCGNRSNLNIAFNNIHDINSSATPALTATHAIQYTVANAPAATSNVNVLNNCISNVGSSALTGNSASAIGFLQSTTTGTLSNLTIAGNTISNVVVNNSAWPTGKIAYGIQLNAGGGASYFTTTGKIVNASIQNNEIEGLSGHIATGIALEGNTENASVTGNLVTNLAGTKSGIRSAGGVDVNGLKFENNRFASTVTVTNNSFAAETYSSNNTAGLGYAVANYVPASNGGTASISCNWLGSSVLSEIVDNDDLTGKILNKDNCTTNFIPFLVSGTDAGASVGFQASSGACIGGQTVFVKDANTLEVKSGHTTIQAGVNAAAAGDIVEVSAGSYTENVSISKSISLLGPNAGVSGYDEARVAEAQILNGRITISGTHTVVVDGMQLYTTVNTSVDLILINSTTSTVTIKNNRIERFGTTGGVIARGIATAIGITTPVVIENNFFTGDPSGGLFSGHVTLNNGIFSNGGSNILIKGNKFDQTRTAVNIDNMSAGVTITENIFENNGTALAFGGTTATSGSYTVSDNSFKVTGTIANLSNVTTSFRLNLTGNTFDGKATGDLSLEESFEIERTLFHRGRSSRNGAVTFVPNTQFVVTQNPSIQNAVTYSEAGGTVQVEAGTYTEDLLVSKPLTLLGANANITYGDPLRGAESKIQPLTSGQAPVRLSGAGTSDGVTINGFEITGAFSNSGIYCGDNGAGDLDIKFNHIHSIGINRGSGNVYAINYRVNDPNTSNVNFSDNYITNVLNTTAAALGNSAAIWVGQSTANGVVSNLTVERNIISNIFSGGSTRAATGISIEAAWGAGTGGVNSPVIRNNSITNINGGIAYGIQLTGKTPGLAVVENNALSDIVGLPANPGWAVGINVPASNTGNARINNNSFSNLANAVLNGTANTLDATCNWWGTTSVAEILGKVTGEVTVTPFTNDGTDNDTEAPGFQPVPGTCEFECLADFIEALDVTDTADFAGLCISSTLPINQISGTGGIASIFNAIATLPEGVTVTNVAGYTFSGNQMADMVGTKAAIISVMTADGRTIVGDLNGITITVPVTFDYLNVCQEAVDFFITFNTEKTSAQSAVETFVAELPSELTEEFAGVCVPAATPINEISGTGKIAELFAGIAQLPEGISLVSFAGVNWPASMAQIKAAIVALMEAVDPSDNTAGSLDGEQIVFDIVFANALDNACTVTHTVTVTFDLPADLQAQQNITEAIACNGGTATIAISAIGGVAPYTGTGEFTLVAGTYTYTVTDANGCSSDVEVIVTEPAVLALSSAEVTAVAFCFGDESIVTILAEGGTPPYSYTFNGETNEDGVFNNVSPGENLPYSITDANLCDAVSGTITVSEPGLITGTASDDICNTELPYTIFGQELTAAGVYEFTLEAANGCDSLVTFTLAVRQATSSTTHLTICQSEFPYTWNGGTFTEPGTYVLTIVNTAGCDSVATLNLGLFAGGPEAPINPIGDSRCNRGPVSLSATPPAGATIDWFTAASGGSLVGLGSPTLNLPDLVQTTTFYARSRNTTTGCTSAERLAVTASITIVPVPDGVNASRCDEGTLELIAIPNETFTTQIIEWYDQPIGGTLLGTGTTFITPVISSTTSFYAAAKDEVTGCASISRKEVVARVNASPQTPTSTNNFLRCNPGTLTLIATTASSNATIYWYADEVGGTPLRTFSNSFTTPVLSTTTTYYAEAISFDLSCNSARIPVTAEIAITPEAPVLEDVSICGPGQVTLSVPAVEGVTFDWYSTLTGGTALATGTNTFVTPELTANTRYFVAARNEAKGCTSARTGVWARINPLPAVLSPQPTTICGSGSGILRASAGLGATIDWFADEACTELLLDGGTLRLVALTTPALTTTTTFYARARNLSTGCVSQPEAVVATVAERPVIVETTPADRCGPGSVSLSALASNNAVITWHGTAVVSTILATGDVFVTPSLTASRTYFAQARDTISGCITESRTSVAVTILPIPAAPIAAGTPSTCAAETITLSASVPSGHQISWFTAASGGTLVAENTHSIVVSTSGQLTYFAESRSEITGCVSARTAVSFSPSAAIAAPLGTDGAVCNSGRVALSAAAPAGSVVRWYSTPVGGSVLFTGDNYLTPILTATTDYYAESFNTSTGCISAIRTAVAAVVNPNPSAPVTTDVALCGPGEAQLNAPIVEGLTYDWYPVLSGGTALATGTSSFTTPVLTATTRFFVAARNEATGCVSSRTSILATVNPLPAVLSTVSATTCGTGSVSLRATTGTGATVDWFADEACTELVLDGGTLRTVIFNTPSIATTTIFYARARNINTGCVSQPVAVTATVAERPTVLEANPVERCGPGSVTLTAVASNHAIITWHGTATISTILATGNTYTTPSLTASRAYFAQARDTITGCISEARSAVAVTIQPIPAAPVSAGTPSTCAAATITLAATVPAGHQISWYTAASGGTLVAENTSSIVVSTSGPLTYFAESRSENTGCVSARTAISFAPSAAVAAPLGTDGVICNSGRVSISATAPSGAVVRWYSAAEGGNVLLTGNTYLTPIISATTVYYAESFNTTTGCISARTPVTATVNPNPGTPVTSDVFICGPGVAELNLPEIEGLTYDWYTVLSGGTALATGTNTYTTPFLTANTRYYVAARDEVTGCVSTRAAIWARINPLPVVISTTPGSVCGEGTATLRATTGTGATLDWFADEACTQLLLDGGTLRTVILTTPSISTTTTFYVRARNVNTGCVSQAVAVVATVNPLPSILEINDGFSCVPGALVLSVGVSANATADWFISSTTSSRLATGTTVYLTPSISTSRTYYAVARDIFTGCVSQRVEVQAIIDPSVCKTADPDLALDLDDEPASEPAARMDFDYQLKAYPNPTSGLTQLEWVSRNAEKVNIRLYNSLGQVAYEYSDFAEIGFNIYQIDLSSVSQGVYYLSITNGKDVVKTQALIKQ